MVDVAWAYWDCAVLFSESVTMTFTRYVPVVSGLRIQEFDTAPGIAVVFRYHW